MHHIFVSYSRVDAGWVSELVRRLEAAGHETWLDQRDIPMTLPWFEQIGDAITGADLFLICDSPASRRSANCGAEATLAFDTGKRSFEVKVGDDLTAVAGRVGQAVSDIDPPNRLRTELAVLARDWDQGGRKRNALVGPRVWRRMKAGVPAEPPLAAMEVAFLKACRKRSRRRRVISVGIGLTIAISLLFAVIFNAALKQSNKENDHEATVFMRTNAQLASVGGDPYEGLSVAAKLGQNESANDANVVAEALATGVPDDAFRVPYDARHFDGEELAGTVAVVDAKGAFWQRATDAHGVRTAHRARPEALGRAPAGTAQLQLQADPDSATVEVLRDGKAWRRIVFSVRPRVLQLSPDGRELAAASGNLGEIADLQLGVVRTTLSGANGPIRDLAWSTDGTHLWALGKKLVVSWNVRDGDVLLDNPGDRYEALLPGANSSTAWAAAQGGELLKFNVRNGETLASLHVPDEILSGAGAQDGSVAALSGKRGLWIVPLNGAGEPQLMHIPGCDLGRPTFADPQTLFLPCLSTNLMQIDVARRKVERRIHVAKVGVFAARPLPHSGALLISDALADLFVLRPPDQLNELFRSKCGGSITRIGASANGRVIAPVGSGTGLSGCLRRGVLKGDNPGERSDWGFVAVDDKSSSALAEASAVSRSGDIFAYGYSDGTVVLHPTNNILPVERVTNVVGEIRDMYVTPDNQLLVATSAGIVQRIPLCGRCLSNRAMARLAQVRLERGLAIGTAVRSGEG